MTQDEVIATIRRLASPAVMSELQFWLDLDREDPEEGDAPYDLIDALEDVSASVDSQTYGRAFDHNVRDIEIALGYYVVATDEELSRTITLSAGRKVKSYAFIHHGLKYRFNSNHASGDR